MKTIFKSCLGLALIGMVGVANAGGTPDQWLKPGESPKKLVLPTQTKGAGCPANGIAGVNAAGEALVCSKGRWISATGIETLDDIPGCAAKNINIAYGHNRTLPASKAGETHSYSYTPTLSCNTSVNTNTCLGSNKWVSYITYTYHSGCNDG